VVTMMKGVTMKMVMTAPMLMGGKEMTDLLRSCSALTRGVITSQ